MKNRHVNVYEKFFFRIIPDSFPSHIISGIKQTKLNEEAR